MQATDQRLITLLQAIQKLALLPYPFDEDDAQCNQTLILALGQIAGIASKALFEYERR